MQDPIKRTETTHINEVTRTAVGTVQWFAENRNLASDRSHPITHNNKLKIFICGEEGFGDIAQQIIAAKMSIDLCCWGFDPGMELVRTEGTWPRGDTLGDLLIAAGKRGVKVRLLVWHDRMAANSIFANPRNMPGYTHDTRPWRIEVDAALIGAKNSVAALQEARKAALLANAARIGPIRILNNDGVLLAREEYCYGWYKAAFNKDLAGIEIRTRCGNTGDIKKSLAAETNCASQIDMAELERMGLVHLGTHHQKPILIDYAYDAGSKAVGYVMGLNALTDYWDTKEHKIEDLRREQGGKREAEEAIQAKKSDQGFRTYKPYQDYACRIDAGGALICLHRNFVKAWDRAGNDKHQTATLERTNFSAGFQAGRSLADELKPPSELVHKARRGDSTVQIVRTQPEELQDKTIKEAYFQATDIATNACGYLYLENQYFQYQEWSERLISMRKKVVAGWKRGSRNAAMPMASMPLMHVFIVIPVPELSQMVPRTHDALSALGQHDGMSGQNKMIEAANSPHPNQLFATETFISPPIPTVVAHANTINKPDVMTLEDTFGMKIATAMLQVSGFDSMRWRYREIYVHSKLLLIDDTFITLGSANLNQRSMAVDSEMNIATNDPELARDLRRRIWMHHSGGMIDGGNGKRDDIAIAFKQWHKLMYTNLKQKDEGKRMTGFLLPLADKRPSILRLG